MNILFKKLSPDSIIPTRGSPSSAGYDLYSVYDVTIGAGTRQLLKLGFSTKIPEGYYGHISDRSGVAWKKGLHTMGKIIDSDYRGEWGVILLNTNNEQVHIQKGERIAQVIFHKYYSFEFQEVEDLESSVRGEGGFGSTGV